ncbi:ImmA/IrrE family metallo-endopeptidase [Aeromicrobium sp. CnD17-E]|uniref:ImmA/IrrE family metallo-endopeptidase n=1 Tax=Aeromicrobium sp. CnD17-E TaxID=2954487 RepID=UPI0020971953|nr:ImmA/IrrE family metallo-endopeptidase [Aeromicrobium sp. CnD17-E]MCO7238395.1 ImmA/IrrE family metallo-endopeptidase [Aeromicrobium sp. CnD17-E]
MSTKASNLTNATIANYAERVGQVYEVYDEDGRADLDALLKKLGGTVEYESDGESLHVDKVGRFTVFIPRFTSQRRDRFTIAHELGHYFLHYVVAKEAASKAFARGGRNRAETEANVFASALLMPANEFRRAFHEFGGDAWALAERFEVSPAAAEVRAQVLGL